jgi:transglutaminase-like putative cysteine protease
MRLMIEHETHYKFEASANHSIQYLRLTPRREASQMLLAWDISTRGSLRPWTDGFGNFTHVSIQDEPHLDVPVFVRGEIETVDTNGVIPASDGLPPLIFLRETPYTKINAQIRAFALPFHLRLEEKGIIDALHALMGEIHDSVEYKTGQTRVDGSAAEALEQGVGVCQDHAHLFIACCRVIGVPARYVSGYLWGGGGRGHLASHAWAEAFVQDLGWVSFDPTNSQSATEAYVRLAVGFDYATACPVRGSRRGGGDEILNVRVQVDHGQ